MDGDATMDGKRERDAQHAYLKLLAGKGAAPADLERRVAFLARLTPLIQPLAAEGASYRQAVETAVEALDQSAWPFCLMVAREYFHFWAGDFKSIAALNADGGFDAAPIDWRPAALDVKAVWHEIDQVSLSTAETWPLKTYTLALRQAGAERALVETRVRLAKLLLTRLREAPAGSSRHYRVAVDATTPLFAKNDTRRLFFAVVREFYYFWIGDPDVASRVEVPSNATSFV